MTREREKRSKEALIPRGKDVGDGRRGKGAARKHPIKWHKKIKFIISVNVNLLNSVIKKQTLKFNNNKKVNVITRDPPK